MEHIQRHITRKGGGGVSQSVWEMEKGVFPPHVLSSHRPLVLQHARL